MRRSEWSRQTRTKILILSVASGSIFMAHASPLLPNPSSHSQPVSADKAAHASPSLPNPSSHSQPVSADKTPSPPVLRPAKKSGDPAKGKVYQLGKITVTGTSLAIMCALRVAFRSHFSLKPTDRNKLVCYPANQNNPKSGWDLYCENNVAFMEQFPGWGGGSALPVWRPEARRFYLKVSSDMYRMIKSSPKVKTVCHQYHSLEDK